MERHSSPEGVSLEIYSDCNLVGPAGPSRRYILYTRQISWICQRRLAKKQQQAEPQLIKINLRNFQQSKSKTLLEDLISRLKVVLNEKRHGRRQPDTLKERLRAKSYDKAAKSIHVKSGMVYLVNGVRFIPEE